MDNNWISLDYIDIQNRNLIREYFPNKTGSFKIENNTLYVNFDNWGIEKFYLIDTNQKKYYNVIHNNIKKIFNVALTIQIGNWNTFKKMEHYLNNFNNININIYFVIVHSIENNNNIEILKRYPNSVILSTENKGMDIGLFLVALHYIRSNNIFHDYIFKIHTKTHDGFRNDTLNFLMGSHQIIINNIRKLSKSSVGMISGNIIYKYHENKDIFNSNHYHLKNLIHYLYNEDINHDFLEFSGGTFFLFKFKIFDILTLNKLVSLYNMLNNIETLDYFWYSMFYNLNINNKMVIFRDYIGNKNSRHPNNLSYQIKTNKQGLRDCMVEHAFERLFGYICKKAGHSIIR